MSNIKKKILIVSVITILIFSLDGYFIWSADSKNVESEEIITNINTEIVTEVEKTQIQASIQATEAERQTLDSYFIDQKGEVSFVDSLKALGNKAGVTLSIDSATFGDYQTDVSTLPVELVNIRLKSTGSWSAVIGFWTLLESTPYRLDVKRVDLEKGESLKSGTVWNQSLDVTAYKKK